jgi:hypothetical protein
MPNGRLARRVSPAQQLRLLVEKAWLPKPFLHDVEWAFCDALVNNPKLQQFLPIKKVPIQEISPTQSWLDKKTVSQYAKEGNTSGGLMIHRNGVHHLFDGHHRFHAALENQQEHFKARVLSLPNRNLALDSLAQRAKVDPGDVTKAMSVDDRRHYEKISH